MKTNLTNYMKGELELMNKKQVVNICSKALNITKENLNKLDKNQIINKYIKERNRAILKG